MRRSLFIVAYVALVLAICVEMGSTWFVTTLTPDDTALATVQQSLGPAAPSADVLRAQIAKVRGQHDAPPGYGIPSLVLVDALLLLVLTWMLLALIVPQRLQGRLQGLVTFLVALFLAIYSFFKALATLMILIVMVTLSLAMPFGFLAYLALWGFFAIGTARAVLSISMLLKIVFAICLVLANPMLLKVKSLVLLIATSLLLDLLIVILIRYPPSFLASITDAIAGIICAVVALIWSLIALIPAIISMLRAIRVDRATRSSEG